MPGFDSLSLAMIGLSLGLLFLVSRFLEGISKNGM